MVTATVMTLGHDFYGDNTRVVENVRTFSVEKGTLFFEDGAGRTTHAFASGYWLSVEIEYPERSERSQPL